MITLTLPWWGWLLYIFAMVAVMHVSGKLGDRLGRKAARWYLRRKTQRAQRDTIKA